MTKKRICPFDKLALRKIPIVWGLPSSEYVEHLAENPGHRVILGGCCIPHPMPRYAWECPRCGWYDYPGMTHDAAEEAEIRRTTKASRLFRRRKAS